MNTIQIAGDKINLPEIQQCFSQRKLMNYATANLSNREKIKIENHLLVCEKCINTLQEVLKLKDASEAEQIFSKLFETPYKTHHVEKQKGKKSAEILIFALTAVFILCGTASIFYFNSSEKNKKIQVTEEPKPVVNKLTVQVVSSNDFSPAPIDENDVETPSEKVPEAEIVPSTFPSLNGDVEAGQKEEAVSETFSRSPVSEPVENKSITEKPVETTQVKPDSPTETKVLPFDNSNVKSSFSPVPVYLNNYKVSLTSKNNSSRNLKMVNYKKQLEFVFMKIDRSEYNEALNETNFFLQENPGDLNGKYYRGYIYYLLQDNENAMSDFEWILTRQNKIFYEDARWHKILILNRTARFAESKKLLNDMITENSSFARKAKQLLELIEDK